VPAALDHFELFGLTPSFAVDLGALEAAYKRVQAQVHPDRFATGSAAERRVAMQWATQANEAYRTLRDPGRRAAYLCERHGVAIDAESNTAMPPAFLMQQMTWREALDDVRASGLGGDALMAEVEQARVETTKALAEAIDVQGDYARAAALVRQLMFIDRFRAEPAAHVNLHQAAEG
jgi:molecular chaperone HscB